MESESLNKIVSAGTLIDNRYEVLEVVSSEEQEILLRVKDITLSDTNFLKLFVFNNDTSRSQLERFRSEVIITRRLSHPSIVGVYDLGRYQDKYFYITTEPSSGSTLQEVLHRCKDIGLPLNQVLEITYQIAHALNEIHSKGVLHRNINPKNILVEYEGEKISRVVLTHFGYGKLLGHDLGLTKPGELLPGNPAFMAPEQIRGENLDGRTDLYSLGMLTYSLITGRTFEDVSTQGNGKASAFAALGLQTVQPDVAEIRPDTPPWLQELIRKAILPNKDERISSAAEILDMILLNSPKSKTKQKKRGPKVLEGSSMPFSLPFRVPRSMALGMSALFVLLSIGIPYHSEILNLTIGTESASEREKIKSTHLLNAVLTGDEPAVFRLLKEGVKADIRDKEGIPLLSLAVLKGNSHIIYTILSENPSGVNDVDKDGQNPLLIAVKQKNLELTRLLVQHGANPDNRDNSGVSPRELSKSFDDPAWDQAFK